LARRSASSRISGGSCSREAGKRKREKTAVCGKQTENHACETDAATRKRNVYTNRDDTQAAFNVHRSRFAANATTPMKTSRGRTRAITTKNTAS
jgi:hypothetical protein